MYQCRVRHPQDSYMLHPSLPLEETTPGIESVGSTLSVIRMQERTPASQAVLSRMQLTLHPTRSTPHGASCLWRAMPTGWLKIWRDASRHCRDTRAYDHTTTAVHDMSTPPRASPPTPLPPICTPRHMLNVHATTDLIKLIVCFPC